jgi:hypothetical protein
MRGVYVKKKFPSHNTSTDAPSTYIHLSPIIYEHGNCEKINKELKIELIKI